MSSKQEPDLLDKLLIIFCLKDDPAEKITVPNVPSIPTVTLEKTPQHLRVEQRSNGLDKWHQAMLQAGQLDHRELNKTVKMVNTNLRIGLFFQYLFLGAIALLFGLPILGYLLAMLAFLLSAGHH